jgi:hypothetical protein
MQTRTETILLVTRPLSGGRLAADLEIRTDLRCLQALSQFDGRE